MRRHPTIILLFLLTSCAAQPSQTAWTHPWGEGWRPGSVADSAAEARQRRSVPAAVPAPLAASGAAPSSARATPSAESLGSPLYHVLSDGVVGCADPKALRELRALRDSEKGTPRALAEAHRAGRCMTVFKVSQWKLEGDEGDVVRLSLVDPAPGQRATTLNFLRGEVEAQP